MNTRSAWITVLGLVLAGNCSVPLCAQQAGLPDVYSFSSTNAFVGQGGAVTVNRNGSKELIEISAGPQFHTVTLYDFQAGRLYTLDLTSRICTTQKYASAYAPTMLDPVGGAAEMQRQVAANPPKNFSAAVVNGIRTKAAKLDSPEGTSTIWLDDKFGFMVKMAGPMGGKNVTAFEMRQLSYAPSPTALFTTPAGCKEIGGVSDANGGRAEISAQVGVEAQAQLAAAGAEIRAVGAPATTTPPNRTAPESRGSAGGSDSVIGTWDFSGRDSKSVEWRGTLNVTKLDLSQFRSKPSFTHECEFDIASADSGRGVGAACTFDLQAKKFSLVSGSVTYTAALSDGATLTDGVWIENGAKGTWTAKRR